eukprot:XP_001708521.1 Hypothetical protein GL50803_102423 [Giardia lamblia ATCC 50803]
MLNLRSVGPGLVEKPSVVIPIIEKYNSLDHGAAERSSAPRVKCIESKKDGCDMGVVGYENSISQGEGVIDGDCHDSQCTTC